MSVLEGYLEILYSRVFTFHLEPCSANRLLLFDPIFLPTSSLTPHLGSFIKFTVLLSSSPVTGRPKKPLPSY